MGCHVGPPPLDGYVAVCLVLTIEVYDLSVHLFNPIIALKEDVYFIEMSLFQTALSICERMFRPP